MFGLLLAFAVEAGWMLWFRFHVSSMCSLGSLLRFPRGFHALLWETLLAASLLRDVTGKAVLEAV